MKKCLLSLKLAILSSLTLTGLAQAQAFEYRVYSKGVRAAGAPAPEPMQGGVLTADTSADFGAVTLGSSVSRSFTYRNVSNKEQQGLFVVVPATEGLSVVSNSCGTKAAPLNFAPAASCSITLSYGGSKASRLNGVALAVPGDFSGSPAVVELTGAVGNFNATASWSSTFNNVTALKPSDLSYGRLTVGASLERGVVSLNTGTNGGQSLGYTFIGDTSQFEVSGVVFYRKDGTNWQFCHALSPTNNSLSPCLAEDITTPAGRNAIQLVLRYKPTTVGNHTLTVTPTTGNGTALPEPVTFTGSAEFNPTASWSSTFNTVTAPKDSDLSYGQVSVGSSLERGVIALNTGTNGGQSLGYTFSGDTTHFEVSGVLLQRNDGTNFQFCHGATSTRNALSPCLADDIVTPGGRSAINLVIRYKPLAVGAHTLTVTPITSNGTTLPMPLTFTGSGK
jgi:hypothetical protein